jgi:prevent-host-death family protein
LLGGFTTTGFLDTTTPILMFCIAFGLSMDYEVFLLSRIKEEHDLSGDNVRSVAAGLEHTGRIVTAAAALLAIVFIANVTSKITFIKLFGVGLTMAVLMDATLVRGALVPAFMRLAGEANWWLPRPLRRMHDRVGIREGAPEEAEIAEAAPAPPADAALPRLSPAASGNGNGHAGVLLEVSMSDLRANADEYLRRAAAGDRFLVTSRGKPVAVVGPHGGGR